MKKLAALILIAAVCVFIGGCGDKLYKECVEKSMKMTEKMVGQAMPEEAKQKAREMIEKECEKCKEDKETCAAQLKKLDEFLKE